jgi:uncharacterized membrane protein (UPF0127 family)
MARLLNLAILAALTHGALARDLDKLYEKANFKIGPHKFTAYIADDDGKREQGLMYVEKLPENVGMLFIFPEERPLGFWMKNTLIPLQIGFLNHEGKVVDMQEMKVAGSVLSLEIPTYQSKEEAQFALEMNTVWFTRHKIKAGDQLELDSTAKSPILNRLLPRKKVKLSRQ